MLTEIRQNGIQKTLWLFRHRLALNFGYYPMWPHAVWRFHENGGRHPGECFDATLTLCRLNFGLTLWGIGRWSRLLYLIPGGRGKEGLWFGTGPDDPIAS
jgi:hypothetical protein